MKTSVSPRRQSPGLPAEATSFVGRRAELNALCQLLATSRLVTVTGTGGIGKTRLALRAARSLEDCYADGVRLVRLSALRAPDLLPNTVHTVLGLHTQDARPALEPVITYLRDRRMLLILDTCEHLAEAPGEFALAVTRQAPGVTVLATSRQPLGVPGERTFGLAPLPVPRDGDAPGPGDAVELFVQRAASAAPGFALDDGNRADIVMICQRLAGIPLALELAAVRLRALSVAELVEGFGLDKVTGSRRTEVPRHRDLRSAIGWSYELCTEAERTLWRRLSVFAGSFGFAAVAQVCAGGPLDDADTIADALDGLARKSVLTEDKSAVPPGKEDRHRLLDPIREFGAAELEASRGADALRGKYIGYYLGLARGFAKHAVSGDQLTWYDALRREHPNIRGAMEYAFASPGNERAASDIVSAMFLYWNMSGMAWEGEYWVNRALKPCAAGSPLRARLLAVRAYLLCVLGEVEAGREDAVAAIKAAERTGDSATLARGYTALHRALTWSDDLSAAASAEEKARRLLEDEDDLLGLAQLDMQVILGALRAKDTAAADAVAARGLKRLPVGELWAHGFLLGLGGTCAFIAGRQEEGVMNLRRAVTLKHELGDTVGVAYAVASLALVAADQGRYERAVWLLGAAEATWELAGRRYTGNPFLEAWHQRAVTAARGALGPDRFQELWERGATTGPDALALFAFRDVDGTASPASE
ncbi:MAG: LuxR family transcriptional regulator [Nocardiopsaceae bacterium]|nr:LuxR family transcriptional regulator [Nocardiopsaceae bacterium]